MGPGAIVEARARAQDPPPDTLSRAELRAAVCGALRTHDEMPPGALACARGERCEAARLSGGAVVGRVVRRAQTCSHVLCPLCAVAAVQAWAHAGRRVAVLPFCVRAGAGPDDVHPRDCHPVVRDGAPCVAGNMVTLAALGMRWDGAALAADGLDARDAPPNGPLRFCLAAGGSLPWLHLPATPDGLRRVSPLVARGALRAVSLEAGVPHLLPGGDEAAWEAAVAAAWDAAPGRRLWLGALLDAAAAGGDDWHGPWPGDLVDVLAVADEVSLQAIYGDTYSAPGAWLAPVAVVFKTMPRPAYRRECAQILARMAGTCPGMWPLLHDALTHALLGTWPVPARRPSLAHRRAALRFVSRAAGGPRAWLERHPPLVLVAAFYARYVAERARGATWAAQSAVARHFWARFEGVLEHARAVMGDLVQLGDAPFAAAAAAPDAPGAARVRAFATAVARWAAAPRGNVAAARAPRGADMCVAPGGPPRAAGAPG